MFHTIRPEMSERMRYLEELDAQDRSDGTPHDQRLRQIPPETGRFLAILAANTPEGAIVEIGTSGGYSTLWLGLAAEATGRRVITFEVLPEKVELARETFRRAGIEPYVELVPGDAREYLDRIDQIAFCFMDADKEIYGSVYETVVPRLVSGGIFAADNAITHRETLQPMLHHALTDQRVDGLVAPIGKGVLVCRKI